MTDPVWKQSQQQTRDELPRGAVPKAVPGMTAPTAKALTRAAKTFSRRLPAESSLTSARQMSPACGCVDLSTCCALAAHKVGCDQSQGTLRRRFKCQTKRAFALGQWTFDSYGSSLSGRQSSALVGTLDASRPI
jgi:hypothetical protein